MADTKKLRGPCSICQVITTGYKYCIDCYKELNKQRAVKRYLENKEEISLYIRNWEKKNPEKYKKNHNFQKQVRRGRLRGAEGRFSRKEWEEVKQKQDNKCAICYIECNLTVDHIYPVSKGGHNYISNIQGLCRSCNSKKGNKIE